MCCSVVKWVKVHGGHIRGGGGGMLNIRRHAAHTSKETMKIFSLHRTLSLFIVVLDLHSEKTAKLKMWNFIHHGRI